MVRQQCSWCRTARQTGDARSPHRPQKFSCDSPESSTDDQALLLALEITTIPAGTTLAVHIVFLPLHIPEPQGTLGKCLNQCLGPQFTLPPTSASHLLGKMVARCPSQVPQQCSRPQRQGWRLLRLLVLPRSQSIFPLCLTWSSLGVWLCPNLQFC